MTWINARPPRGGQPVTEAYRQLGSAAVSKPLVLILPAAALLIGCAAQWWPDAQRGARLFDRHCASCHARGGGPRAAALPGGAPDLTRLAARNGGDFPMTRVMSVIDGYTRSDQHGSRMPEFGTLLEGRRLLWQPPEGGQPVPTPEALIALADHIETLQR